MIKINAHCDMAQLDSISGAELARFVLNHPHGGVKALLKLAGDGECDWLECKAAMVSRPVDRRPNENDQDAYWHVAEAVIALANSRGGVVLVGIEDRSLAAVSLQQSDPRGVIAKDGLEAYRRKEIYERVNPASGEWRTGLKGNWRLEDGHLPEDCIEVLALKHEWQDIAAILVRPVKPCIRLWKNEDIELILRRAPGQVGKVEGIKGSKAMDNYDSLRPLPMDDLSSLLNRFKNEVSVNDQDAILETAIATYYGRLCRENADLLSAFTPLDAEENQREDLDDLQKALPRNIYEPEAEEWFAPDEDWSLADDEDVFVDDSGNKSKICFDLDKKHRIESSIETDKVESSSVDESEDNDDLQAEDESDGHESLENRISRRGGVFALLNQEPREFYWANLVEGKPPVLNASLSMPTLLMPSVKKWSSSCP